MRTTAAVAGACPRRPRFAARACSRDLTRAAKGSIASTTVSKRMEWNRSYVCCTPGSSAYTTGVDELLRGRSTKARASSTSRPLSTAGIEPLAPAPFRGPITREWPGWCSVSGSRAAGSSNR